MKAIPPIGLGTWELRGKECQKVVEMALELGYRHIDTAHMYENHVPIGKAIASIPREELFITSKVNFDQLHKESVEESCDRALKELQIDEIDLYLLHYPNRDMDMKAILSDLAHLVAKKKIRRWGVSNFTIHHLQNALKEGLHPFANQVEFHPYLYQKDLLEFCRKNNILLISFRTLGKGRLTNDPLIAKIAHKYKKTTPQILLRWCIEKNIPVIPKASSKTHLQENLDTLSFSLYPEDIATLDTLPQKSRFCDTAWADFAY